MYVEIPIKVKSYDTDCMKIVNNTVYVKWFEDLRLEILDNDILYCQGQQIGYYFDMIANKPTRFDEKFLIEYQNM